MAKVIAKSVGMDSPVNWKNDTKGPTWAQFKANPTGAKKPVKKFNSKKFEKTKKKVFGM